MQPGGRTGEQLNPAKLYTVTAEAMEGFGHLKFMANKYEQNAPNTRPAAQEDTTPTCKISYPNQAYQPYRLQQTKN